MKRSIRRKKDRLHIAGEMTIYTAAQLHTQLVSGLDSHPAVRLLDLSQVTEVDTAGLQLLLAARSHARARGRELHIADPSQSVSEMLGLLQLDLRLERAASSQAAS